MQLKNLLLIVTRLKSNGVGFIDLLFKSTGCLNKELLGIGSNLGEGFGRTSPKKSEIEFSFSDGTTCLGKVHIHSDNLSAKGFNDTDFPDEVFTERLVGRIDRENITIDFSFSDIYHLDTYSIGRCRIVYYP